MIIEIRIIKVIVIYLGSDMQGMAVSLKDSLSEWQREVFWSPRGHLLFIQGKVFRKKWFGLKILLQIRMFCLHCTRWT